MKITLLRLNATLKVAQLISFIFLKFRIIILKKMHSNLRMYCVLKKCTEFYFAILSREVDSVNFWLQSGKDGHIMRGYFLKNK
jgi:hypothetical protein